MMWIVEEVPPRQIFPRARDFRSLLKIFLELARLSRLAQDFSRASVSLRRKLRLVSLKKGVGTAEMEVSVSRLELKIWRFVRSIIFA